jgi:ceramide glucosyltransferase
MRALLTIVATLFTAASTAYCLLCGLAGMQFISRRKRPLPATDWPSVSILKPLKGTDPEMYESLRSHCVQDYPHYEILFGVGDPNDPAVAVVERLQREFPQRATRLISCDKKLGANRKVSSLAQMAKFTKYDVLLISDSDIRVDPEYLRTVISELQQPNVGLVTCLYRGVPARTFASKLESLGISTDFMPSVLAAGVIERGIRFGLGATLAFRSETLDSIGGFEPIIEYLADDYELGRRIADNGRKVVLSTSVVETFLPAYGFKEFFTHQMRWARTIRGARPVEYVVGLPLTFTLFWGLLNVAIARSAAWSWTLLVMAALFRTAMAVLVGSLGLRDRDIFRSLWMIPIRDLAAVLVWMGGFFGHKIVWRGEVFQLQDGKLTR